MVSCRFSIKLIHSHVRSSFFSILEWPCFGYPVYLLDSQVIPVGGLWKHFFGGGQYQHVWIRHHGIHNGKLLFIDKLCWHQTWHFDNYIHIEKYHIIKELSHYQMPDFIYNYQLSPYQTYIWHWCLKFRSLRHQLCSLKAPQSRTLLGGLRLDLLLFTGSPWEFGGVWELCYVHYG